MVAAGDVSDYDAAARLRLADGLATTLGVDASAVSLDVTAASVHLRFLVLVADADAVLASMQTSLATAVAASAALGVQVLSAPIATTHDASVSPPPPSPPPPPPPSAPPPPPPGPSPLPPPTADDAEAVVVVDSSQAAITGRSSGSSTPIVPIVVGGAVAIGLLGAAVLLRRRLCGGSGSAAEKWAYVRRRSSSFSPASASVVTGVEATRDGAMPQLRGETSSSRRLSFGVQVAAREAPQAGVAASSTLVEVSGVEMADAVPLSVRKQTSAAARLQRHWRSKQRRSKQRRASGASPARPPEVQAVVPVMPLPLVEATATVVERVSQSSPWVERV